MAKRGNNESKEEKKYVETPLMKQYYSIKATHPEAILLFRVGDFYETFGEDAIKTSEILGITLTKRAERQLCEPGFPTTDRYYMPKLVRAGMRVAICEQLEDPKSTKGIVKRCDRACDSRCCDLENTISAKENRFLASIFFDKTKRSCLLGYLYGRVQR